MLWLIGLGSIWKSSQNSIRLPLWEKLMASFLTCGFPSLALLQCNPEDSSGYVRAHWIRSIHFSLLSHPSLKPVVVSGCFYSCSEIDLPSIPLSLSFSFASKISTKGNWMSKVKRSKELKKKSLMEKKQVSGREKRHGWRRCCARI